MQAGRRALGRLPGDCSGLQSLVSRRSWPRVFHPQSSSRRMFGRWLIFRSRPDRSARKHVGPVRLLTNVRSPRGHPSLFPSGTPACSHSGTQRLGCGKSYREERGLLIPVHQLVREDGRRGVRLTMSRNCCHRDLAAMKSSTYVRHDRDE